MAFSTAQRLQELGVATPLAKELGVQIDANSFNWRRLMWASMPVQLAKYLADNLPNGTASNSKLAELGMIPAVIALITGGGVPAGALRSRVDDRVLRSRVDDKPLISRAA